jgi:hypothetical protein
VKSSEYSRWTSQICFVLPISQPRKNKNKTLRLVNPGEFFRASIQCIIWLLYIANIYWNKTAK